MLWQQNWTAYNAHQQNSKWSKEIELGRQRSTMAPSSHIQQPKRQKGA